MQHREYKVTTWPFKGKWNWNVTEWKDKSESNVLTKGNGCKSSAKAYTTGKRWIELYRSRLARDNNNGISYVVQKKSFRRVFRPIP